MQTYLILGLLIVWSAGLSAAAPAPQDQVTTPSSASLPPQNAAPRMSRQQLDELVGPIALYPDVLLAQVLAASTYPLDVIEADRWLKAHNNDAAGIDRQDWDASVKSVAHFPQVIAMMSEKIGWMRQLGEAVVSQQQDVMEAVQRSRARAEQAGALKSDQQQKVEESNNVIVIEPANPQVIYVPVYQPQDVYYSPSDYYPYGYSDYSYSPLGYYPPVYSGGWLDMDCDWYGRSLYYGGWGFRHGYCDDDYFYKRHHRRHGHSDDFYGNDRDGRDFDRYVNRWQHESRGGRGYARRNDFSRTRTDFARNVDAGSINRELASRNITRPGESVRFRQNINSGAGGSSSFSRDSRIGDRRFSGNRFGGDRIARRSVSPPSERNFISRSRIPTQRASLIRSGDYGSNILQNRVYTRDRSGSPEGIRQFGIQPRANRPYRGFGPEWSGGGVRTGVRGNPISSSRGPGGLRDSFVGPRGPVLGATPGGGSRGSYIGSSTGYRSGGSVMRGGTSIRGPQSLRGGVAGGGRNFGRSPAGR